MESACVDSVQSSLCQVEQRWNVLHIEWSLVKRTNQQLKTFWNQQIAKKTDQFCYIFTVITIQYYCQYGSSVFEASQLQWLFLYHVSHYKFTQFLNKRMALIFSNQFVGILKGAYGQ